MPAEAQKQDALFTTLIATAVDGIIVIDGNAIVQIYNNACERLFGYTAEEVVGHNVKIQNNVSVYTGVILEDDVFCGPSMVFTNVINPRSEVARKSEYKATLVKRGASLGANSTIVCGITIGAYAFVGAGAVVTRDVPDFALVVGNPARRTGWMCRCGVKLGADPALSCVACRRSYRLEGGRLHAVESA
jgi:UDP-2-acetamido-3-amino-2,3-dideoxy-glucuronate N-acetyltransferase